MPNILLDRFTRLNQSVSSELIDKTELITLEDMVLDDETGHLKKRGGFARYNANQVDSSDAVKSLHDIISSDGTNYLLAGINGKLRKSTAGTGTWGDVTANDSGANDKGDPPYRMETYDGDFIFTNGITTPFVARGAALGTIVNLEIAPMSMTSVNTGHQTGGALETNAQYKWIFCYVTEKGELSPPSQPVSHRISLGTVSSTDGSIRQVGFENIPASTDTRVVGIRIFRTLRDSEIFYYHSQIDNVDTNWLDNKPDSFLGSEAFDYLNCPSTSKYLALHKERIWHGYITRNVKNFIRPALSETALGAFSATVDGYTTSMDVGYGFTLVAGTSGTATLGAGTYQYRVVFVDSEGFESDPYDSPALAISGADGVEDAIDFREIPFLMDNPAVVRADVYRTSDGGTHWYKVFDYNPNYAYTYAARDGYSDEGYANGTEYATNVVSDTTKTGVAFSSIGQPSSYPLENLRNVYPDDGDEITGLHDDGDGLIVFKKNSICKIWTSGSPNNWRVTKVLENIGCSEPYSLAKYGGDYYFAHYNKIYKLGNGYEDIGESIKDILATPTIYWYASAVSKRWYMVSIATSLTANLGQYLLVYDLMLKTWYKFNLQYRALSLIIKEHGATNGTIILANADYILNYGTGTVDATTGSNVDIVPLIRTKTFKFPDGFSLARLRKFKFNYKKQDGKNVVITVGNPDTGVVNTFTDSTDSANASDWKQFDENTKSTDSLKTTSKIYFSVTGAGLIEWGSLRQEYYPIQRGQQSV